MYYLNNEALKLLSRYRQKTVAEVIGISVLKLRQMTRDKEPCMKQTAYAITKFLDSDKEIKDFFIRTRKDE